MIPIRPVLLIVELSDQVKLAVREQTRDSVELKVNLSSKIATDMQTDSTLRVMVYCAADSGLKQFTKSDIAFPHQVELKANLDEVKANLRGLKNRPGTTQPADVTNYIRKKPNYTNNIVMTYALTQKVGSPRPETGSILHINANANAAFRNSLPLPILSDYIQWKS